MIQAIDQWLFYAINTGLANPVSDVFFPFITDPDNMVWVYGAFALFLIIKYRWTGATCVLLMVVGAGCSDALGNELKDLIGRLRPCRALEDVHLLVHCGMGKSFPSNHAINNFAFAAVVWHRFPSFGKAACVVAALVALSRVVVGVHYPFDILGGAALGAAIGLAVSIGWNRLCPFLGILGQKVEEPGK